MFLRRLQFLQHCQVVDHLYCYCSGADTEQRYPRSQGVVLLSLCAGQYQIDLLQLFMEYGPTFQLDVTTGNRPDRNSADHILSLIHQIHQHLSNITVSS